MRFLAMILFLAGIGFIIYSLISRRSGMFTSGSSNLTNSLVGNGSGNRYSAWPEVSGQPEALGVPLGHPARPAAERLEAALDSGFEERIKGRLQQQDARLSDQEWSWTWLELKRFFLMSSICANVPMYSKKADEIWHEMLMFTRDYEQFCIRFCGEMIHHAPHGEQSRPSPSDRAWFDWLYNELFILSPVSGKVWGAFFKTPFSAQRLADLEGASNAELREKWFHKKAVDRFTDVRETVDYLISRAQSQLHASRNRDIDAVRQPGFNSSYDTTMGAAGILSGLLIFNTLSGSGQFQEQMDSAMTDKEREASGDAQTIVNSSDSSIWHDDHPQDGSSCSSGSDGGSSCSSDGGSSCSSSCSS